MNRFSRRRIDTQRERERSRHNIRGEICRESIVDLIAFSMENESPGRRKRARDEEAPQDDSLSLEDHRTFSDTMVALRIMRTQFPKMEKVSVEPFILRSQLYSSVKDRTQVDRELESLRKEKVLRIFKLNTGQDDQAVMFMDDYLKQMDSAVKRVKAKDPADVVVFEWFKMYVITSNLDVGIGHHELCFLLSSAGNVKDDHISLLINAGLVVGGDSLLRLAHVLYALRLVSVMQPMFFDACFQVHANWLIQTCIGSLFQILGVYSRDCRREGRS
ncbi:uncharacterized protein LOC116266352 isoform X3 [Nymphaea colorata]|nr:uncharacterized protein LOC116266352 isoform X3 [Nymphaea colorata]